jgi:hypothetical protein
MQVSWFTASQHCERGSASGGRHVLHSATHNCVAGGSVLVCAVDCSVPCCAGVVCKDDHALHTCARLAHPLLSADTHIEEQHRACHCLLKTLFVSKGMLLCHGCALNTPWLAAVFGRGVFVCAGKQALAWPAFDLNNCCNCKICNYDERRLQLMLYRRQDCVRGLWSACGLCVKLQPCSWQQ